MLHQRSNINQSIDFYLYETQTILCLVHTIYCSFDGLKQNVMLLSFDELYCDAADDEL